MTPAEVLRKARARIERGWCRQVFARDRGNHEISTWREGACRFCMRGALMAEYHMNGEPPEFLMKALGAKSYHGIAHWNDAPGRTKTQVLRAFDRAIALAEGGKR